MGKPMAETLSLLTWLAYKMGDKSEEDWLLQEMLHRGWEDMPNVKKRVMERLVERYGPEDEWEEDHKACMTLYEKATCDSITYMDMKVYGQDSRTPISELITNKMDEFDSIIQKIHSADSFEETEKRYLLDRVLEDYALFADGWASLDYLRHSKGMIEFEEFLEIEYATDKDKKVGRPKGGFLDLFLFIDNLVPYLGSINKAVTYAATFPQFMPMHPETLKRKYRKHRNK